MWPGGVLPAGLVGGGGLPVVALASGVAEGPAVGEAAADGDEPPDGEAPADADADADAPWYGAVPAAPAPGDRLAPGEPPLACADALPVAAACGGCWTAQCVNGACGPPVIAMTTAPRQTASTAAAPRPA